MRNKCSDITIRCKVCGQRFHHCIACDSLLGQNQICSESCFKKSEVYNVWIEFEDSLCERAKDDLKYLFEITNKKMFKLIKKEFI